jgi:hypothetical protein
MNLQDMQNNIIARLRQFGVNWGANPTNTAANFFTPYECILFINQGYCDFLSKTMSNPIADLKIFTNSITNSYNIPLNPIHPLATAPTLINPSAMRVHEFIYQQAGSFDRKVDIIGTEKFRNATAQYQARFGVYTNYPEFATQMFGRRQLDMYPGMSNSTDIIKLTITPDPGSSPVGCLAINGGMLAAQTDVPLFPPQFHIALVHYVVAEFCAMANKGDQEISSIAKYQAVVDNANDFGANYGEGSTEQSVESYWD